MKKNIFWKMSAMGPNNNDIFIKYLKFYIIKWLRA